jgi:palmitoyltransferase
MNCVGANNYKYFLSLLLAVSVLLIYGTLLGYSLLWQTLREIVPLDVQAAMKSWSMYLHVWSIVITRDPKIGTVTLLMLMTAPLAVAFLAYHTYLIWAGMTTNESAKWSDWKEDVLDGFVFKAKRSEIRCAPPHVDLSGQPWPVQSDQILVTDGQPPLEGYVLDDASNRVTYRGDANRSRPIDRQWVELHHTRDLENIYDMGFRRNLVDALGLPVREKFYT